MFLYTIGFTRRTAEEFFEALRYRGVQMLIDVRLNNKSWMAKYSYGGKHELGYILGLINCNYEHKIEYAPTKEILNNYKKKKISWNEYEIQYRALMQERKSVEDFKTFFYGVYDSVCLLCSEPTPEHCHRRLFAEMIQEKLKDEIEIEHIVKPKKEKKLKIKIKK